MKQYIINVPQLQSMRKRLGGFGISVICWLMWGYLLYPIITVINWLRGDYGVINEMRWFGGYKSLLELMQIYVGTLAVLGVVWLVWIFLRKLSRRKPLLAAKKRVSDDEISAFYHIETEKLWHFRKQKNVTVFFDENGLIVDLKEI